MTTYNQKYCSDECCREETNLNIKKMNYEKKNRLSGKQRICSTRGCKTVLVKYNESSVCELCEAKKKSKELKDLLGLIGNGSL